MKLRCILYLAALLLLALGVPSLSAQSNDLVTSTAVFVPDTSHQEDPLPPGILAWDAVQKNVEATNGQEFANFTFYFTNTATQVTLGLATNVVCSTNYLLVTNHSLWRVMSGLKYSDVPTVSTVTNIATVTNSSTPVQIVILDVHPSCGCTTAELPARPWILPPGTNSSIPLKVNLLGKSGMLFKTVTVKTDKGKLDLILTINILPPPAPQPMSQEERDRGIAASKLDRQAVFKGDCASCHAKNIQGKYGQQLFENICGICHESHSRASMVPDLHNLKEQTSEEFWRAWITNGKPGTLMPAFAKSQGGPLDDFQIASLATYLNQLIPPHAPQAEAK